MPSILVSIETEEKREVYPHPVLPVLQAGGPGSGWPPPYLVATGQAGHAVVGMDIGTRFSRIATFESKGIQNLNPVPIPSIACRQSSGNLTVGVPFSKESTAIIQNFRHLIGTDWYVEAGGTFFSADMLLEILIKRLITMAASAIERPVSKAVLTVPTTYNSLQRKLVKQAAQSAGVDVLQLINEPTAAAFAYCYENHEFNGTLLVYHLGAGSFSASVMDFRNGILEVKATRGSNNLGGNTFVGELIDWLIRSFESQSDSRLERNLHTIGQLQDAAEQAIEDMYMSGQANIKVTQLDLAKSGIPASGWKRAYFMESLTFKEYLKLTGPIVDDTLSIIDQVLEEAHCLGSDINQILLVADVRPLLPFFKNFYERMPGASVFHCNPAFYPVNGAALQAALLSHSIRDFVVWDVLTEPVFVQQNNELKQVIARGTPLPITAYHKSESPDATINVEVMQGAGGSPSQLAEVTINNCPPTTEGETKVEIQFMADADGIIDYRARHIGLEAALPITVMDGQPVSCNNAFSDTLQSKSFDDKRLDRLCRIMNLPLLMVLNVLRSRGYSVENIKNGRAIESMLHALKKPRKKKAG